MTYFTNVIYYSFIFYIICPKSSKKLHLWHQNICWVFYVDELLHLTEHVLVLVPLDVIEVVHEDVKYTLALGTSRILRKNWKIWGNSDNITGIWQIWQKSAENRPKSAKNRPNLKIRISTIVDLVSLYLHKKFQPSSLNNSWDLRGGWNPPPPPVLAWKVRAQGV